MSNLSTNKLTFRFQPLAIASGNNGVEEDNGVEEVPWNYWWMHTSLSPAVKNGSPTMNRLRALTYSELLYRLNLIAFLAHLGLAITVLSVAKGPVNIQLWSTRSRVDRPNLNDLIIGNATFELDFVPYFELDANPPTISVLWFTTAFFLLSAAAHAFVVVTAVNGTVYYKWIHDCRQPLR